ncbi:PAS domain-containing sensor histidine kinase [Spirosoma montaniterrae]|uniref:histidine kinase n=1 Tax=Spirosoma montaniterrae TaxID=1178516 RepID=A0A1P9WTV5_9BACT|nr:PAS domain-containing protein [Spirosoma montaniterrae]AQG78807.1 hypothetical protein AWR27_05390 [Spirosoma montaniterrae]
MNSTFLDASPELLRAVFDNSLTNIYAAQAMRDVVTGQIIDFNITLTNPAFRQRVGFSDEVIRNATLLTLFTEFIESNLFARYVAVIETGEPYRGEEYYPSRTAGRNWFDISVTKMNDGVVVNFIDITDYKQAREQARQSANMIETLVDNVPVAISLLSPQRSEDGNGPITDWVFERVNRTAAQLRGLPIEQMEGRTYSDLFPEATAHGGISVLSEVSRNGQSEQYDLEYRSDGMSGWFDQRTVSFGDQLIMITQDITVRKRTQLLTQQQADQLQATLDASISSILAMTAIRNEAGDIVDFRMDRANRSVERSLGRTPAELEGRTLLDVFPGNVESGFFAIYAKAADTGEPQQATLHYTDVNGYEGWFESSAVRYEKDKIVLTFMNVTEHKLAERLIRQQADIVNSVLNATLTAVATYEPVRDAEGRITDFRFTFANQASLDMLGLPPEELYTKTLCELNPPLRNSDALMQYVAVVQTGKPATLERQIGKYWYLVSAVRFDQDGLLTSSINVTEAKLARQQIEQINNQLRRSNESLDQFASVASHDLQEPLRKIKSFGDLLADQYADRLGDGVDLLRRMQSATTRMQILIRDLLAYARLSQNKLSDHQRTDLNKVVGDVLQDLEVAVSEKNAVLNVSELPTIPGDALQLRQVFQNLLSNALKFSSPGKPPHITLSARAISRSALPSNSGLHRSAYWEITVADNGIGFNEQYREQIFGAFERLHGKSSPYSGTGIGLAIVRRVMENHAGIVTASSTEGQGATFRLYFPVQL